LALRAWLRFAPVAPRTGGSGENILVQLSRSIVDFTWRHALAFALRCENWSLKALHEVLLLGNEKPASNFKTLFGIGWLR
jgi:hypothetical protein